MKINTEIEASSFYKCVFIWMFKTRRMMGWACRILWRYGKCIQNSG